MGVTQDGSNRWEATTKLSQQTVGKFPPPVSDKSTNGTRVTVYRGD
jgi:hypothetical protein